MFYRARLRAFAWREFIYIRRNSSTSSAASTGLMTRVSNGYKTFHDKRPHATQMLQSLVVGCLGDSISQLIIAPDEEYSPFRTVKVMLTGSVLSLPTFRWFLFMGRHINHSNKYVSVAMKVVANQLFFAPLFLSSFLSIGIMFQGVSDPAQILQVLKERLPVAWTNGCMFWPNVVALNFTVVPPHFRGLVNSTAAVIWQAYLSWLTFSSKRAVDAGIEAELELEHAVVHELADAKTAVVAAERKVLDYIKKT
ncbi:hypothetical protein V1512DRAFT_260593 [Lipomyces arxii]|uniref:uncharacterized protein n=1 Tax=Lipomyces arxii TaxID=56418 RepID=UPI0034CDCD60